MTKKTYKKKSYKRGSMAKVTKILAGAAIAALYEVFVSPMIPLARNIKNILEMIIGIALLTMRNTYLKSAGIALLTINAFEIIVPLIKGVKNKTPAINSTSLAGY